MNIIRRRLNDILYAGTDTLLDHDPQKWIVVGVNLMSLSIILLDVAIGLPVYLLARKSGILVAIFIEACLLFGTILLNHFKKYNYASLSIYLIMGAATLYFGCIYGKIVEAQLMVAYMIGVALFMFPDIATRIFSIGIAITVLILLEQNSKYEFIKPFEANETAKVFIHWLSYVAIIVLIILTFVLYSKNNRTLQNKLQDYASKVKSNLDQEEMKNKMKSTFIQNAYHEVRGSFFGLFVIIQTLDKVEKKDELKNWGTLVNHLKSACQNLKMILNNILEYSKFESGIMDQIYIEPINLRQMLGDLVDISEYEAIEKHVRLNFHVSNEIPDFVSCDRIKITQIATNLINNAIKFSYREGCVHIHVERDKNYWKLVIEDEGRGISREKMERLFDPFITEKGIENPEGIGLGLHITKQLVELLKGRTTVSSRIGKGARFTVSFPLHLPEKVGISSYTSINVNQ